MLSPLPQVTRFSGDDSGEGEMVEDWVKQFESVATLARWNDHFKLVHLIGRLKGPALSFFQACSPEVQSDYNLLIEAIKKRFKPVHLSSVQSQLFHERRQKTNESVDEYAQELRKLFRRAYVGVSAGGPEGEVWRQ